jgi:hypothetical protein
MGLGAIWAWIAARAANAAAPLRGFAVAAPVLLLAFVPVVVNARDASRRGQTFTADWARDLLQSVEPYGVLITAGDNDSFPVWYAQQVEGVRRDVTIALIPYLNMEWYAHQLIRERVTAYDGSGVASYAQLGKTQPTGPLISLSPAQADSLPPYVELRQAVRFQQNGIDATIPAGYLTRDQLMTLQFIRDAFPGRSIHFSIGPYAQSLGLQDYVVIHGLTQKLLPQSAKNDARYVPFPGGAIDVERTKELWKSYGAPAALLRQERWLDEASVSIPAAYVQTAQFLAYGLASIRDSVGSDAALAEAKKLAAAARLGEMQ